MDVIDAIKNRRSVRSYQDKAVAEETLLEIIEAGRLAPSGNNTQPWKYKVITSTKEKDLLQKNNIFKQNFAYTAPAIIICCADPSLYPSAEFDEKLDDENTLRAARDLGISSQNMVLRATELGLGTCYVGWMDKAKIKELFQLPKQYITPYAITVGYAANEPRETKRKNIDEILL